MRILASLLALAVLALGAQAATAQSVPTECAKEGDFWTCAFECRAGDMLRVNAVSSGPDSERVGIRASCGGAEASCEWWRACEGYSSDIVERDEVGLCITTLAHVRGTCASLPLGHSCSGENGTPNGVEYCRFSCAPGDTLYVRQEPTAIDPISNPFLWGRCPGATASCSDETGCLATDGPVTEGGVGLCNFGPGGTRGTCSSRPLDAPPRIAIVNVDLYRSGVSTPSVDVPVVVRAPETPRTCTAAVVCAGPVPGRTLVDHPGRDPVPLLPPVAVAAEFTGTSAPTPTYTRLGPYPIAEHPVPIDACDPWCSIPTGTDGELVVHLEVFAHAAGQSHRQRIA